MFAAHALDGAPLAPGRIIVAPPDSHLMIQSGVMRVAYGPKENRSRPSIDVLFRSVARECGEDSIGVMLSGALDDGVDEMFRLGLRAALTAQEGIEIVAEARDGKKEAIARASQLRPDVILMDLRMPVVDGIAAIKTIRDRGLPARCLVLTTFEDVELLNEAVAAGAAGYILKGTPINDVAEVIGIAHKGTSPFSPGLVQLLSIKTGEAASALADDVNTLSQRQRDVFELVGTGMTNRQIAEALHLSEGTVRNLVSAVLAQLCLHHRTEAALLANHARVHWKLMDRARV